MLHERNSIWILALHLNPTSYQNGDVALSKLMRHGPYLPYRVIQWCYSLWFLSSPHVIAIFFSFKHSVVSDYMTLQICRYAILYAIQCSNLQENLLIHGCATPLETPPQPHPWWGLETAVGQGGQQGGVPEAADLAAGSSVYRTNWDRDIWRWETFQSHNVSLLISYQVLTFTFTIWILQSHFH